MAKRVFTISVCLYPVNWGYNGSYFVNVRVCSDFLGKLGWCSRDTPQIKNFVEIALSSTVFEI